jgi:hypothetical protein
MIGLLLLLLALFIDSDVTRVALPAIVGAIGTIALAVVTVWLSVNERAYQRAIKTAEEQAANRRQKELEFAENVRQARRVAAIAGSEGPPGGGPIDLYTFTVTLVNGSDYPIFDIGLIGARLDLLGGPIDHKEWPPENRLEGVGQSLYFAVLLPGERHTFRGKWKTRKGYVSKPNTVSERRATYTWKDDQGRGWQRDGNEPPKLLPRPWIWSEFWGNVEYVDESEAATNP